MYSFLNDYSEGACPQVLNALIKNNNTQLVGYGLDSVSDNARELIKKALNDQNVDIHFIPGGTPCNILAISLLKPYEAVISCDTGHINVHETGAIEANGHKIITVKNINGKLSAEDINKVCSAHIDEHMVMPKMVFISYPSELGTLYSKKELTEIKEACLKNDLYLYVDGARLSSGLVAKTNEITLKELNQIADLFYIGATKNGALCGEAMIISNDELKKNFRYYLKQNGMMLAKTRVISSAFEALFTDDLHLKLALNANNMAQSLKKIFTSYNIPLYVDSYTNQIFVILENDLLAKIKEKYLVTIWDKYDDDHTIVRFVCSWATKKQSIIDFYNDFKNYIKK